LLQNKNEEILNQSNELKELNVLKSKLLGILGHHLLALFSSIQSPLSLTNEGVMTENDFKNSIPELNKNI
jgi:hypothetical protein